MPALVTTDASGVAFASYLSQINRDGTERTINLPLERFLQQNLHTPPLNVKRSLAFGLASLSTTICTANAFPVRTDYYALLARFGGGEKGKKPMRLIRWSSRLQQYDFKVHYRP